MKDIFKKFEELIEKEKLFNEKIVITAKNLTPEEAIGNPLERDYPILAGKERMIEAEFRNGKGHAFTDMPGNFSGTINDVLNFKRKNNFETAVYMAVMNAVLNDLRLVDKTIHCKNQEPVECAEKLIEKSKEFFKEGSKILMVGYQPRLAETMKKIFDLRIVDLDHENIESGKCESPENTEDLIKWCEGIFATGSCFANNTWNLFAESGKKLIFYGVTCAGPCFFSGHERYCEKGK
jgi:uncharacterized protein (DUF4213/DUF364 family)